MLFLVQFQKHFFIKKMRDALLTLYDGTEIAYLSSPHLTTFLLNSEGYKGNKYEKIKDIQIFPKEFFFPYSWQKQYSEKYITKNTYAVHYWSGTWNKQSKNKNNIRSKIKSFLKI